MKLVSILKQSINSFKSNTKIYLLIFFTFFIYLSIVFYPNQVSAFEEINGKELFIQNCAGCHINGGNIIRRGKTLKLKHLKKNGLDNPIAIAKIAREGVGSMSGYKEQLGEGGDQIVGDWIWEQAQKAWTQG